MTDSFWFREALAAEGPISVERLSGRATADVCIVGGGFLGLWTAIRLKEAEPGLSVAIVERRLCGSGASGRNGGFVTSYWAKYLSLLKLGAPDAAAWIARRSADAVSELGEWARAESIDCDYRHDGWLWTASSRHQIGAWESLVAALAAHNLRPFAPVDPAEVARRGGTDRNIAGVFETEAATVQPAKLALGLRRLALRRGVRIYEQSPMRRLERSHRPVVHCPEGSIEAGRLVLAMNAWATRIPELRRSVVVVSGDLVATARAPERLQAIGFRDGVAICDSRMFLNYWRTTPSGRIVFGRALGHFAFAGRVGDNFEGPSPRAAELETAFRGLYPMLADLPVETSWTGAVDRSTDGLPFFGRLGGHPNILLGLGFSGQGVGPTQLGGRILASLARGVADEWSRCCLVREPAGQFPPEPFRYIGAIAVREALRRKERLEDAGRRADPVTAFVAGLAPTGYVPADPKAPV